MVLTCMCSKSSGTLTCFIIQLTHFFKVKKKKDLWYKLGFKVLHLVNNSYWPKKIEDFALLFHLPQEHAMKSKLIEKNKSILDSVTFRRTKGLGVNDEKQTAFTFLS